MVDNLIDTAPEIHTVLNRAIFGEAQCTKCINFFVHSVGTSVSTRLRQLGSWAGTPVYLGTYLM